MILADDVLTDAESTFLHLERYVNDGSPSGFSLRNTTSKPTAPREGANQFRVLAGRLAPIAELIVLGEGVSACETWDVILHPDMLDHPQVRKSLACFEPHLAVAPTASGRTVKVLGPGRPHLKLAHAGLLGRIERHLTTAHALSAIEVSNVLVDAIDLGRLPDTLYVLPERGAHVARTVDVDGGYEYGVVQRDDAPYPPDAGIALLVPCFSLFAEDVTAPEDRPLLLQLASLQRTDPIDLLLDRVFPALISAYFQTLLACGLQLELHAQNTLLALDEGFNIRGIVVRDMESVDKDLHLIEMLGLGIQFDSLAYKCLRETDYNYAIAHSYMYDFKLGEYLLRPLISTACANTSRPFEEVATEIRLLARPFLDRLPSSFFPPEWFNYPNELLDRSRRRPYVSRGTPFFRDV